MLRAVFDSAGQILFFSPCQSHPELRYRYELRHVGWRYLPRRIVDSIISISAARGRIRDRVAIGTVAKRVSPIVVAFLTAGSGERLNRASRQQKFWCCKI